MSNLSGCEGERRMTGFRIEIEIRGPYGMFRTSRIIEVPGEQKEMMVPDAFMDIPLRDLILPTRKDGAELSVQKVRLIDANALYRAVKTECNPYGKPTIDFEDGKKVLKLIDAAQTVDATPVRHGRWSECWHDERIYSGICSSCEKASIRPVDSEPLEFCPKCGAQMDGDAE